MDFFKINTARRYCSKICFFMSLFLTSVPILPILLDKNQAFAAEEIGQITHQKGYSPHQLPSRIIHEGQSLNTASGQSLIILLVDGTELLLGPSTFVEFKNWNTRNSHDRLIREIQLKTGMLKAKVKKVYSQQEPFIVSHPYGVVAVRGTEFLVEAGSGGRLESARVLTQKDIELRRFEVEVHVLEGEVYFAKNLTEALFESLPQMRIILSAGQRSILRYGMLKPQTPRRFELIALQKYIQTATPKIALAIERKTSNEMRAIASANTTQRGINEISPAQPAYAQIRRSQWLNNAPRAEPQRMIAQENTPLPSSTQDNPRNPHRRHRFLIDRTVAASSFESVKKDEKDLVDPLGRKKIGLPFHRPQRNGVDALFGSAAHEEKNTIRKPE